MLRSIRTLTAGLALAVLAAGTAFGQAGSEQPSIGEVAGFFDRICLKTAPGFTDAVQASAIEGLTHESESEPGLMYHRALNMSVKVFEDQGSKFCSMVFSSAIHIPALKLAIQDRAKKRLGATDFIASQWNNIDKFTTGTGDATLLWGPYEVGDTLFRIAILRNPDG